jgi:hypothetical protein
VITITLSAADATEHVIHNPFVPDILNHQLGVTLVLLALLGGSSSRASRKRSASPSGSSSSTWR